MFRNCLISKEWPHLDSGTHIKRLKFQTFNPGVEMGVPDYYSYRFQCSSAMWDMTEDKITKFSLFTQHLGC